MKFALCVLLVLSFLGTSVVFARCAFSNMEGAEESERNPHRIRTKNLTRKLGNNGNGNGHGNGLGNGTGNGGRSSGFPLTTIRSITGSETSGAAHSTLLRKSSANYPGDGKGDTMWDFPAVPNAREISNECLWDNGQGGTALGISDMFWQWGQFLDHDIDLTEASANAGRADIACPAGEALCSPGPMAFSRSDYVLDENGARQQINFITSLIDGSVVYGSDDERALALRTEEDGKLKTSEGNLLPWNTGGLLNAGGNGLDFFLAGDIRANEQLGLTAMHTIFVREHNRLAGLIQQAFPSASDEEIYQLARKIVGAEIQKITYKEFLPVLLGPMAPNPDAYQYDHTIDTRIANEFSTMAFRFGHSMVSPELKLYDNQGLQGIISLQDAFFKPTLISEDPDLVGRLIGGLIHHKAQKLDHMINDDIRNALFGDVGNGGFDLGALNIQRGRDHGLSSYNEIREAYGIMRASTFSDINPDPEVVARLSHMYPNVDEVDAWVGGLSEAHVPGAQVGILVGKILEEQFTRLMNGDPFFYSDDRDLNHPEVKAILNIKNFKLSALIEDNTLLSIPGNPKVLKMPS